MKLGKRVILRVIDILENSDFDDEKKLTILELINPFLTNTEEIDLMTICKLEVITGHKLLYVPNKQQLRRLKLEKLNKIFDDSKNK
jgi:hypothetical protein